MRPAILCLCLLLCLPLLGSCNSASEGYPNNRVVLMHTNDMHSHMQGMPNHGYNPSKLGDGTTSGIARIGTLIKERRASANQNGIPVLLLDAGDFMMGTLFQLLNGAAETGIRNYLGYDAVTLGNHEFDFLPEGASRIVQYALDAGVPVLASNLNVVDNSDAGAKKLEEFIESGRIQRYMVLDLPNGIKAGLFGLMGENAAEVIFRPDPENYPLEFASMADTARYYVDILRNHEQVDIVICLSHAGVKSSDHAQGEDPDLAREVQGIDVIISGHTHTNMPEPVRIGNTTIVQAYAYGQRLGVLDLQRVGTNWEIYSYDYYTIDDTILGDEGTQEIVDGYIDQIDAGPLSPSYTFREEIAESAFPLTKHAGQEHNLGDLESDGIRWMVDQVQGNPRDTVDFAVQSDGVIRAQYFPAETGFIDVSDAFRMVPLGLDPFAVVAAAQAEDAETYLDSGYPLVAFYIYGHELKQTLEVNATVYPLLNDSDYWLSVSGLKYTYNPDGFPFFRVKKIWQCLDSPEVDPSCSNAVEVDTGRANRTLYKVATNYYMLTNIRLMKEKSLGILNVEPKNRWGFKIRDFSDALVKPVTGVSSWCSTLEPGGCQEWKGWLAFLAHFPDTNGDGVPDIPAVYENPMGRIVAE